MPLSQIGTIFSITMNTSSSSSTFCPIIKPMASSSFVVPICKRSDFLFFPTHEQNPGFGFNFKALKYHKNHNINILEEIETEPFSLINPYQSTDSVCRWHNAGYSHKVLGSGIILLKNYINLVGQVEIVNLCEKWGVGHSGFYQPSNSYGAKLPLHMTCFGRNWDPVTRYKNPCRSDGSEPPPIPDELISFTEGIFKYPSFQVHGLPSMSPDICLVNFYSLGGRLGLHQDFDESSDSLRRGLPVVSISIGDSAEFFYGHVRDENKLDRVLLESGDVLIFGGKSRLIFHKMKRILPMTCPLPLTQASRLCAGRLNLTLKQS